MGPSSHPHLLAALMVGAIPVAIGLLFCLFPQTLSRLFTLAGSSWPELSRWLYSPKAMRIIGGFWLVLGLALCLQILWGGR